MFRNSALLAGRAFRFAENMAHVAAKRRMAAAVRPIKKALPKPGVGPIQPPFSIRQVVPVAVVHTPRSAYGTAGSDDDKKKSPSTPFLEALKAALESRDPKKIDSCLRQEIAVIQAEFEGIQQELDDMQYQNTDVGWPSHIQKLIVRAMSAIDTTVKLRRFELALVLTNLLVQRLPKHPNFFRFWALSSHAATLLSLKQYAEAKRFCAQVFEVEVDLKNLGSNAVKIIHWSTMDTYAEVLIQLNEDTEAVGVLTKILDQNPNNKQALGRRAIAYGKLGLREPMLADLQTLKQMGHHQPFDWFNMGCAYQYIGERDLAIDYFRKALNAETKMPTNPEFQASLLNNLVSNLISTQHYEEADQYANQLLVLEPRSLRAATLKTHVMACVNAPPEEQTTLKSRQNKIDEISLLLATGNIDDALSKCNALIEQDPHNALAFFWRAAIHATKGNGNQCLSDAKTAAGLVPNSSLVLNAYSDHLRAFGRPKDAYQVATRTLELDPDFPEALLNKAIACDCMSKQTEGLAACDKAIALKPDFASAYNSRGHILDSLGRPEEALESYQEAVRLDPNQKGSWLGIAQVLLKLAKVDEAIVAYEDFIQRFPRTGEAVFAQHTLEQLQDPDFREKIERGDRVESISISEYGMDISAHEKILSRMRQQGVSEHDPKLVEVKYFYHLNRGDLDEALQYLDQLYETTSDIKWLDKKMDLCRKNNRVSEAIDLANQVLEKDPDHVPALTQKAVCLLQSGHESDALPLIEQAESLEPDNEQVLRGKCLVLRSVGRIDEALKILDQLLEKTPWDFELLSEKSSYLFASGDLEGAMVAVEAASRYAPTDTDVLLNRAIILEAAERYDEALNCLSAIQTVTPENYGLTLVKALMLFHQHRFNAALVSYNSIIAGRFDAFSQLFAYTAKGIVLSRLGRYTDAFAAFEQAKKISPTDPFVRYEESLARAESASVAAVRRVETNRFKPITDLPTHYEFAQLSRAVYHPQDPLPGEMGSGWRLVCTSDDDDFAGIDKHGYVGAIYENPSRGQIVVAHRGTVPTIKQTLQADWEILQTKKPRQVGVATQFLTEAGYAAGRYQGRPVFHTGHSLGGAIAELTMNEHGGSAVTFDSPGCREIIEGETCRNVDPAAFKVTTYLASPNPVNTAHTHIGEQLRIFPNIVDGSQLLPELSYEVIALLTQFGLNRVLTEDLQARDRHAVRDFQRRFANAFRTHGISRICETFSPDLSAPRHFEMVTRWPKGIDNLVRYLLFGVDNPGIPDANYSDVLDSRQQFRLGQIGFTQSRQPDMGALPLHVFSPAAQSFLSLYARSGFCEPFISRAVMSQVSVTDGVVRIKDGFSARQLKQYLDTYLPE